MMPRPRLYFVIAVRLIVVVACSWGIWSSWQRAVADSLYRQDNAESIRSAIRLTPDAWAYYMRLAQLDEEGSRQYLETSLQLNPYNTRGLIELGLRYEADGDYAKAEKLLLQSYSMDDTYTPRWSLANFYLRRGDMPSFWTWARKAAEMPAGDVGALFALCWRVSPEPEEITNRILNNNPVLVRQYLLFLVDKEQLQAAASVAPRLLYNGSPDEDRPQLFSIVNALIAANDGKEADALWRQMVQKAWVATDTQTPFNADFARDPLPVSFDWQLSSYTGMHSWTGPSGLETEFSGGEPEQCTIAEQALVLNPGKYTLEYTFHTTDIPPETGIRWQLVDAKSGAILADSPQLSSDASKQESLAFSVAPGTPLLRLRLIYQRTVGTPRISGSLVISSVRIELAKQS
jgi:hypothetical protein